MTMFSFNPAGKKIFNMRLFKQRDGTSSNVLLKSYNSGGASQSKPLKPNSPIPSFSLPSTTGRNVSTDKLQGKSTVLVFYPADWTPVCRSQLALYNEILPMFHTLSARILGISIDSVWSHQAFADKCNLSFPLLADFEPKGLVAQQFGVYDHERGTSQRALFVIDQNGVNRWTHVSPLDVNPGADGILQALESISE